MASCSGPNQYGKAENRVVRIYRNQPRHEIRDLNVSSALRGEDHQRVALHPHLQRLPRLQPPLGQVRAGER